MYLAQGLYLLAEEVNSKRIYLDPFYEENKNKLTDCEYKQKFQEIENWLLSLYPQMREAANKGNYWIEVENEIVKNCFEHLELFLSVLHKYGFCLRGSDKELNQVTIAWNNWAW